MILEGEMPRLDADGGGGGRWPGVYAPALACEKGVDTPKCVTGGRTGAPKDKRWWGCHGRH